MKETNKSLKGWTLVLRSILIKGTVLLEMLSTKTSKNVNKKQGKGKSTLKAADVAGRDELF